MTRSNTQDSDEVQNTQDSQHVDLPRCYFHPPSSPPPSLKMRPTCFTIHTYTPTHLLPQVVDQYVCTQGPTSSKQGGGGVGLTHVSNHLQGKSKRGRVRVEGSECRWREGRQDGKQLLDCNCCVIGPRQLSVAKTFCLFVWNKAVCWPSSSWHADAMEGPTHVSAY